ncbi:hypothetical protein BDA99DRAFT_544178 [Phascolomyces articulosus]|uniref:NAD(P)-binding domain-containing protein n=1 Tax=Phascolomyces articulosus TaxID=60185 RepID=A0AAD5P6Y9_9FUNG|nr:hypothetical protein BDA99DRAFT_544178 [Phascolomyces articulosus]
MSAPQKSHHKEKFVLVSCCDSYVGHALAHYLAQELATRPGKLKKKWRVRALCENLQGKEDLLQAGVDVQQIQYHDNMMLRSQMKGVRSIIITLDPSEQRATNAINIMDAASTENIKSTQMVSIMGCELAEEQLEPRLHQYYVLEQSLREKFAYGRWCVFRASFINQGFYFWNDMIERNGKIGMPLSEGTPFTTISIQDVCDAIATVILSSSSKSQDHETDDDDDDDITDPSLVKRVYELTGSCPYTGQDVAMKLNEALGGQEGEIQYAEISEEELREYLRNKKLTRPTQADPPGLVPDPHCYLSQVFIDTMIDCFKTMERTNVGQKVTNHVRDLTGKEPVDLGQFFVENRHQFRRPSGSQ